VGDVARIPLGILIAVLALDVAFHPQGSQFYTHSGMPPWSSLDDFRFCLKRISYLSLEVKESLGLAKNIRRTVAMPRGVYIGEASANSNAQRGNFFSTVPVPTSSPPRLRILKT
jgi:hypothetical protein